MATETVLLAAAARGGDRQRLHERCACSPRGGAPDQENGEAQPAARPDRRRR